MGCVLTGFLPIMVLKVIPHPLDHVQTDVSEVVGSNHIIPRKFKDPTDRSA
jgi:hypothetical protein